MKTGFDQFPKLFNSKWLSLVIIVFLIVSIPITVYLVSKSQIFKSRATEGPKEPIVLWDNTFNRELEKDSNNNYLIPPSKSVTIHITVPER